MMLVTIEYTYHAVISVDTKDPTAAEMIAKRHAGLSGVHLNTMGNQIIDFDLDVVPDRKIISVIPG